MEVAEFIEKTLEGILRGVSGAQSAIGQKPDAQQKSAIGRINPSSTLYGNKQEHLMSNLGEFVSFVDFDIAVTAEERTGGSGSVRVFGLGAKGEIDARAEMVSRVKFRVPIELPKPRTTE